MDRAPLDYAPPEEDEEPAPRDRAWGCLVFAVLMWAAIFGLVAYFLFSTRAYAHQTASGIFYPPICCSNRDCKPAPPGSVRVMVDGYHIVATGEVVPFGDRRIKDALDTDMHVCQASGDFDRGRVLCLFPPLEGF